MAQQTPLVLSRKVRLTIERKLAKLINKTYTEDDIFILLVELREIARNFSKISTPNPDPKFENAIKQFIEVADCIAHTNRDLESSMLLSNIQEADECLAIALDRGGSELLSDVWKVEVMSGDAIVATMLAMALMFLSAYKCKISVTDLTPVFADKGNISLCIISLLQDTFINLRKSNVTATLHILDHEGMYRLYCRVYNSLTAQSAKRRTGGDGKVIIDFPVMVTTARNIDGLCLDNNSEIEPAIIETFRSLDDQLHARIAGDTAHS